MKANASVYMLDSGRFQSGWMYDLKGSPTMEVRKFRPGRKCATCGLEFADGDMAVNKNKPRHQHCPLDRK